MLAFGRMSPLRYQAVLQEDRFVEWWTVGLFAAAAVAIFRQAVPERRVFDLLVALFCVFVAGEEFSWGQRLLGFTPPAPFLEYNTQQEFTLHNFAELFGQPKGVLILALLGYGLVLPLLSLFGRGRRILGILSATPPPLQTVPWFLVAVGLLLWYPADFTGEWVEALAGGLFLISARPSEPLLLRMVALSASAAIALTIISGSALRENVELIACAQRETEALFADIASGGAARERLVRARGSVHKRAWTAVEEDYLDPESMRLFAEVGCGESRTTAESRRRFLIDPWGMAYWIRLERPRDGERRLIVYSLGPNRRRDGVPGAAAGDDIPISGMVTAR